MPLPNMARFPDTTTSIISDLMKEYLMPMMSSTSNMAMKEQLASMNNTMIAFLAPENHCAFPAYVLSVWMVIFTLVKCVGYFVIVTVTTVVLYISAEVVNVKNMELLQMNNV